MLERIWTLRTALTIFFAENEKIECFTSLEWKMISAYKEVFGSLKEATKLMEGDTYVSSSLYLPLIFGLKETLKPSETTSAMEQQLCNQARKAIAERFEFAKSHDVLITAMLLDPRFKDKFVNDKDTEYVKNLVITFMEKYCKNANNQQSDDDEPFKPKKRKTSGMYIHFIVLKLIF